MLGWIVRAGVVLVLSLVACTAAAGVAQAALPLGSCKGLKGTPFRCGKIDVPLDYSGLVKNRLSLDVRVRRPTSRLRGTLVFLSGGPGQAGIFGPEYSDYLSTLMPGWQIVEIDQRGTGKTALVCPTIDDVSLEVQEIPESEVTSRFAACAAKLGPNRRFYTSIDSARDIEDLRAELGTERIAIGGVSYGTYVSQVYARMFPARTERMLLDSVVPPAGVSLISPSANAEVRRVMAAQCAARRCIGVTDDLQRDVGTLQGRLGVNPLVGRLVDSKGRPRAASIGGPQFPSVLLDLYYSGDLDPFARELYPAAVLAALRGDAAPLLRMRKAGEFKSKPSELSNALFAATSCAENGLPWASSDPIDQRRAAVQTAVAAQPPGTFAPWGSGFVNAYAASCLGWPDSPVSGTPSEPLPDVPTLLLAGQQDIRTTVADARAVAALLPRATVVTVPNSGHSLIGNAECAEPAVKRFMANRPVGDPCRREAGYAFALGPVPQSLADLRATGGQRGRVGRTISALRLTIGDAAATAEMFFDDPVFPGLRHGVSTLRGNAVRLRRYSYVTGVELSGRLDDQNVVLRVGGRAAARGKLRLRNNRFKGWLGGRRVSFSG